MTPGPEIAAPASRGAAENRQSQRPCPDGAVLIIKGERFPCRTMDFMGPQCEDHKGWAHQNPDAEAIWE